MNDDVWVLVPIGEPFILGVHPSKNVKFDRRGSELRERTSQDVATFLEGYVAEQSNLQRLECLMLPAYMPVRDWYRQDAYTRVLTCGGINALEGMAAIVRVEHDHIQMP
ncbi:hypothetical protein HMPREF3115_25810 [Burkholderia sp. HMSC10F09]|nr:hypothetical protein HMPREF3115_25810 [Burkholderia sp. HMSC10F09]